MFPACKVTGSTVSARTRCPARELTNALTTTPAISVAIQYERMLSRSLMGAAIPSTRCPRGNQAVVVGRHVGRLTRRRSWRSRPARRRCGAMNRNSAARRSCRFAASDFEHRISAASLRRLELKFFSWADPGSTFGPTCCSGLCQREHRRVNASQRNAAFPTPRFGVRPPRPPG